jgi:hypothetical protein
MRRDRAGRGNRETPATLRWILAGLATALVFSSDAILAAPLVSGDHDAVRVEAQSTSVDQVLVSLGEKFHLQYSSSGTLDRQITGTYQGSLLHVLARILEGHDFVVKTYDGTVEVSVFGTGHGPSVAAAASQPAKATPTAHSSETTAIPPGPQAEAEGLPQSPAPQAPVKLVHEAETTAPMPKGPTEPGPIPTGSGPVPELLPSNASPPIPTPTSGPNAGITPSPASTSSDSPPPVPSTTLPRTNERLPAATGHTGQ